MLNEMIAMNANSSRRRQADLAVRLLECDPSVGSETISVFLAGGGDLAFEGLKTLLVKNGFNIVGVGQRLRDIPIPAAYLTRRFLVIVDVIEGVDPDSNDILLIRRAFPKACIVKLLDGFKKTVGLLPDDTGANAIVDRNVACETLLKTLTVVLAGYGVLSPVVRTDPDAAAPSMEGEVINLPSRPVAEGTVPVNLSDREFEIIGCIAEGQSNKVIARRFSISESTVKIHVRGILRKVNARNRTQAAVWALHRGFGSSAVALD